MAGLTTLASDLEAGGAGFGVNDLKNNGRHADGHNNSNEQTSLEEPRSDADPDIVDWDGPNDPENPRNWPQFRKSLHVALISLLTLAANLAATMFAPGASQLAIEFTVTNTTVATMTVSLYVLGFAIGPLLLAPLSELYGRLIVYHCCNLVYIGFTFGCAFSTNVSMFLVFRFFSGWAAAGPMSVGGGTIADLTPPHQRGKAMAMFTIGPLIGPVVGPIIGGFVSEYVGWRWTFRIILIMSGIVSIVLVAVGRETNAVVLLHRKAERLRKETGNQNLRPKVTRQETPREMLFHAIVRPTKMLIFSPIVLLISLYAGVIFGLAFLVFTTYSTVFRQVYGFQVGISGLAYLGLGVGMIIGLALFTTLSDKLLGQAQGDTVANPENRLILMKWFGPITPLGCFLYGWSAYYQVHWIAPIIGGFIIGLGCLFVIMPGQIYLIDAFGTQSAASALAANLLVRCPFGAFLVLAASPLYTNLKLGWGNTVLGFICFAFTPVPWLFHRYGAVLRARFPVEL